MAEKILKIKGEWDRKDVLIDGLFLCPRFSISQNRMADSFGWGDLSPETNQLGLALALYIHSRFCVYVGIRQLSEKITTELLSKLPQADFEINIDVTKYTTPPEPVMETKDNSGNWRWIDCTFNGTNTSVYYRSTPIVINYDEEVTP